MIGTVSHTAAMQGVGGELGALGSAVSQRRSGRRSSPAPVRTRASVCVCARAPGRAKSQCPVMVGDLRSAQTLRVLGLNQYSTDSCICRRDLGLM